MRAKKIPSISKAADSGISGISSDYRLLPVYSTQERIFAVIIMKLLRKSLLFILTTLVVMTVFMTPPVFAEVHDTEEMSQSANCSIDDAGVLRFPPHKTENSVQFTGQLISVFNKTVFGDPFERQTAFSNYLHLSAERYHRLSGLLNISTDSTVLIFPFHFFL